jgi:hypothetical protein
VAPRLVEEAVASGAPGPREWLAALVVRLLGTPLVTHDGGSTVAAHLHRGPKGQVLHLVHWALDRWGTKVNSALHFPKLGPLTVSLACERPPSRVTRLPDGAPLPWVYEAGRCRFTVPSWQIWQVIHLAD